MSVWLLLCWAAAPPWSAVDRVPLPLSLPDGQTIAEPSQMVFDSKGENLAIVLNFDEDRPSRQEVWNLRSGKRTRLGKPSKPMEIRRLLPTRRGEWIGVGSLGVARWDARGRCRSHFEWEQPQELLQATLDADEKQISCYYDRECLTYASSSGKEISRREFDLRRSFEVQPGGCYLAVCEHQDAELRDPRTGKLLHSFDDHPGRVYRVGLSADQKTVVVVWRRDTGERISTGVSVWDVATGKCRNTFFPRSSETVCAIAPAGDLIAINEGNYVSLYAIPSGEPLYWWPCDARHRLEFSPDGRYLAALGKDLTVWRLRDRPR